MAAGAEETEVGAAGNAMENDTTQVNYIEFDGKACTHEVAYPSGTARTALPPPMFTGEPAKSYPFKIDPFQQTAMNVLEAGDSVLVAAHTSAGKTVVAEYAFAMAIRDKQRVVYTSPLKALSNQKYRELQQEFGDVGLMTGDVTINPTASCLVMTTEILRSMLYRGSEVIREVQLLVYDEIHYLRDKERGVVWEESIILAPKTARFVFLSATIPNAREFAEWIAKIHNSPCHVVYTEYRPTPLEHYVFPTGGDGVYLTVDSRGTFREDNFAKAVAIVNDAIPVVRGHKNKSKGLRTDASQSDIYKLVQMIMQRHYDPVIVFSFSKKECEKLAAQMSNLDLNSPEEKKMVNNIFQSAIEVLSVEDQNLPQIRELLPILQRGFGVHHSGLLPLLKELVEILFQEGLLKVLFATETFSTGLNMPAKTVVFTHVRKFDGGEFRWVSGGEYIQMSGRAGRRGLDEKGIVIMILDAKMEPSVARGMLKGAPDNLYSEFHLAFNMLLNLLRVDGIEPEELMRRSYRQFQVERMLPAMRKKLIELQGQHDAMEIPNEERMVQYYGLLEQRDELRARLATAITQPKNAVPFLQPGRLLKLAPALVYPTSAQTYPAVWVAVVNFQKVGSEKGEEEEPAPKKRRNTFVVDVLMNSIEGAQESSKGRPLAIPASAEGIVQIVPLSLDEIEAISSIRLYMPKDLRSTVAKEGVRKALSEVEKRFSDSVPELHPVKDMHIKDKSLHSVVEVLPAVCDKINNDSLSSSPQLSQQLALLKEKQSLNARLRQAVKDIKDAGSLVLLSDLKARRQVLKFLGYIDSEGLVSMKGRVASEISTGDELVLTELLFSGFFKQLRPSHICAILSCFVWTEQSEVPFKPPSDLDGPFKQLRLTARRIGETIRDYGMISDPEEYVKSFSAGLMQIVQAWAEGARFIDVMKLGKVFEGSIVRSVRRLEELLRQLVSVMQSVGETEMAEEFSAAAQLIRRDIIFAASLYL